MAELPSGRVTFVFTDIEGSTRLLIALGSRYEDRARRSPQAPARRLFVPRRRRGRHPGRRVLLCLPVAHYAITATDKTHQALSSHDFGERIELRVRMDMHTGEPTVIEETDLPDFHKPGEKTALTKSLGVGRQGIEP